MLTAQTPTVWIDVEDMFDYFDSNPRPSGIQRLAFELMRELVRTAAAVRFVRRGQAGTAREVPWESVEALFARNIGSAVAPKAPGRAGPRPGPGLLRTIWRRLPAEQRQPLLRAIVFQRESVRNMRLLAGAVRPARPAPVAKAALAPPGEAAPMRPGDCYLVLGAPWAVPGFADYVAALKQRTGIVVAVLFYDLIPVRNPEWCTRDAVALFDGWLRATLPLADRLMAISRHTADDVTAYAREQGLALPGPVGVVPVGTGFTELAEAAAPATAPLGLPKPGGYV